VRTDKRRVVATGGCPKGWRGLRTSESGRHLSYSETVLSYSTNSVGRGTNHKRRKVPASEFSVKNTSIGKAEGRPLWGEERAKYGGGKMRKQKTKIRSKKKRRGRRRLHRRQITFERPFGKDEPRRGSKAF